MEAQTIVVIAKPISGLWVTIEEAFVKSLRSFTKRYCKKNPFRFRYVSCLVVVKKTTTNEILQRNLSAEVDP